MDDDRGHGVNSEEATELVRFVNRLEDEIVQARREADQLRAALRQLRSAVIAKGRPRTEWHPLIEKIDAALAGVQAKEDA